MYHRKRGLTGSKLQVLYPTPVFSTASDLSLRLSSHPPTPTIPPSAGLVETAQPIRTLAIKLEDGVLEEGGEAGGCERRSKEEGAEEAEEQLEVTYLPLFHPGLWATLAAVISCLQATRHLYSSYNIFCIFFLFSHNT